jgi:hypothetical protein
MAKLLKIEDQVFEIYDIKLQENIVPKEVSKLIDLLITNHNVIKELKNKIALKMSNGKYKVGMVLQAENARYRIVGILFSEVYPFYKLLLSDLETRQKHVESIISFEKYIIE